MRLTYLANVFAGNAARLLGCGFSLPAIHLGVAVDPVKVLERRVCAEEPLAALAHARVFDCLKALPQLHLGSIHVWRVVLYMLLAATFVVVVVVMVAALGLSGSIAAPIAVLCRQLLAMCITGAITSTAVAAGSSPSSCSYTNPCTTSTAGAAAAAVATRGRRWRW